MRTINIGITLRACGLSVLIHEPMRATHISGYKRAGIYGPREDSIKRTENWFASGAKSITGCHCSFRYPGNDTVLRDAMIVKHPSKWPRSRISNLMDIFHCVSLAVFPPPNPTPSTPGRPSSAVPPRASLSPLVPLVSTRYLTDLNENDRQPEP